ncbi:DNA helicase [Rhodococcus phage ReqiPine5]|uniref:Gp45 n=1 Tax=Rhodococcus phage ReqiPine5 TaxID=691963 RepID=D4P820_9CAUD|nr:DNA helicase [Rhodococcus phage ReqiPine5]ADD81150.1 gp45 [Rhodococcus phage ReqiPine5]
MPTDLVAQPRILRPYQQEAVDAVLHDWDHNIHRVAVVLPTGAGKSTVIGKLADVAYCLGDRVVLIAHRRELLGQMRDAILAVSPSIRPDDIGIVRGAEDNSDAPIVVASVQTLLNDHRLNRIGPRDVVLWDEVHHIGAQSWHGVAESLGIYEGTRFAGFTATLRREDDVALSDVIEKVSYEKDLRWAIDQGFLVQPRGLTVKIPALNALNRVKMSMGDFQAKALGEVMQAATDSIVDAYLRHCVGRQTIIFVPGVEAGEALAEALRAASVRSAAVFGSTPDDLRDAIYSQFRDGVLDAMITVQVLTEGADFPMCDCVVMARPTKSQTLYSQMVGRAIRLWEGKTDALVVDLTGVTRTMSLVTLTSLDGTAPIVTVDEDGREIEDEPEETTEEAVERIIRSRYGSLELMPTDLMGYQPQAVWLTTRQGTMFFQTNDHAVFLYPATVVYGAQAEGFWVVGYMTISGKKMGGYIPDPSRPGDFRPGVWSTENATTAMEVAEAYATDHLGGFHRTTAPWRQRRSEPSEGQLYKAARLGIDTEGMTRVGVSDAISIVIASDRLDVPTT